MKREPEDYALFLVSLVCACVLVIGVLLMAGCACNTSSTKVSGATCARQVVIGGYTAVGATAVIARPGLKQCEDKAVGDKSQDELNKCAASRNVLAKVLPATEDALHAVPAVIDTYEAVKAKDYGGALAPLYGALAELAKALTEAGIKLPVKIPGVN